MNHRQPNIVLITCHDLGRFLGTYGVGTVHTPHLDAFAADGVRFDRAFCTAPQCSPSRASLFTGRYPHSNGMMGLAHGGFAWDLHPGEQHLGQVLQAAGYATRLVGVHHESLRTSPDEIATRCGMDEVIAGGPGNFVTERARKCIADIAQQERPFYLQVGYHEPHRKRAHVRDEPDYIGFLGDHLTPDAELGVTIPPYLRDTAGAREELAELQGAVRYVDAAIGHVLDGLREHDQEENTLVVVTTDHGIALPRAKCAVYDPGLEIALMLRFPARGWIGGRSHSELVSNVDVFPTLLDALGLPIPKAVQGRSFRPLLDDADHLARDAVFGEMTYHDYYDPRRCIRTELHKLIVNFSAAPGFMDPSQSWRPRADTVMPTRTHHELVELYDLQADPWETRNLADEPASAAIRAGLLAQLSAWMHETDDPILHGAVTSPIHRRATEELKLALTPSQATTE